MKKIVTVLGLLIGLTTFAQPYSEIDKVIASDREEFDRFGEAVAISDTWAVVGAYGKGSYNNGQIYIYEKQGLNWVQTQILQNSDNENYDRFGWSVAIDGDWIVVGAPREDDDANGNNNISKAGSAYIYKNNGGTWSEVQKIVANDRSADDELGWSVDIDSNTIIVGAHQDFEDVNGLNPIHHAGSCYFFDLNVGTGIWTQTQKVIAGDRASDTHYPNGHVGEDLSDQFGHTVGISGDYVIIGALNHDFRPNGSSAWQCGSAYVFERNGGTWTEVQQIINSDNAGGVWERFGSDVAIDSNIIVVGMWAQDYTTTGTDYMKNAGAAYIFVRDNVGTWNENQKLDAGMRNSGDHFGWDVKINDGIIIAGTEHDDHDENESTILHEAGSAYLFQIDGAGMFNQIQKIVASDRDSLDIFGYAVDTYGVNAISGAFQHDWNLTQADSLQEAGAAYIFSSVTCIPVFTTQSATICNGQTFTEGASVYTTTGTYNDYYTAASGCDSIVTTNLTVNPTYDTTLTVSICDGDSFLVGNSTYTSTGNYTDNLTTVNGCDSIVHTNLTVNPNYNMSENVSICSGDSYIIGSSTYTTAGVYTDVLTTIAGCDSIVITNLTVNPIYNMTENVSICDGDSYTIGNSTYTSTGVYTDVLTTIAGCDSTVITNLTVNPTYNMSENVSICDDNSYTIGSSTYTSTGVYTDVLTTIAGCDSIVITNLTVHPTYNMSENVSICDGDSYIIGSSTYTSTGVYTDVLTTIAGCDSIVITNLTVNLTYNLTVDISICDGDSYTIGSSTYSTTGNYTDVLTTVAGCDSTINTNLTVIAQLDLATTVNGNEITANQNGAIYQWLDCDNNNQPIINANQQTLMVDHIGNFACIVTAGSCVDTTDCVFVNYVGINDNNGLLNLVEIYPNPSNGNFVLELSEMEQNYSVKIMDLNGKIVYANPTVSNTKTVINLDHVSDGIYFIELSTTTAKMTKKLVIQK